MLIESPNTGVTVFAVSGKFECLIMGIVKIPRLSLIVHSIYGAEHAFPYGWTMALGGLHLTGGNT
jgi:hypothetical protein